jgi:hypothetical protein
LVEINLNRFKSDRYNVKLLKVSQEFARKDCHRLLQQQFQLQLQLQLQLQQQQHRHVHLSAV